MTEDYSGRVNELEYILRSCKSRETLGATMFDGCPVCHITLDRDQHCRRPGCANFGKHVSGLDNIKRLREIAETKKEG